MRFSSNVLAEITIVPLVLAWAGFRIERLRALPLARRVEAGGAVPRAARGLPARLRPAALRRHPGARPVVRAAAVPALGRGALRRDRHHERARAAGGRDHLGRGARPGAVHRRHAAGHRARPAALSDRRLGAAAAARGGARGAAARRARDARAAPAAHAPLARRHAGRDVGRPRARAEPAAHRDPLQRAGGGASSSRTRHWTTSNCARSCATSSPPTCAPAR